MRHLDFISCLADPVVWTIPAKKSDVTSYYEYILLYNDDALVVSQHSEETQRKNLGRYFELKEEYIGPPKIHLGGNFIRV